MKKIILLTVLVIYVTSCKKDNTEKESTTIQSENYGSVEGMKYTIKDLPDSIKQSFNVPVGDSVLPVTPQDTPQFRNPYENYHPPVVQLRIQDKIYAKWSGVNGCDDAKDADRNVREELEKWVQKKWFEHRDMEIVSYNIMPYRYYWRKSTNDYGKRSCSGSATVDVYIEFGKQGYYKNP